MRHQLPCSGWTVTHLSGPPDTPPPSAGRTVGATVPGCVHTDLMNAGLLADPHLDDNEPSSRWIGWSDWRYRTAFDCPPPAGDECVDLVCHGLDTVARVELNGTTLGTTQNMHRGYRFPVTALLAGGHGELTVDFSSAERLAAEREAAAGGEWPNPYHRPYAAVRKMACNFGWDWGPDLVTAGIWQPVELHRWRVARLRQVRPVVRPEGERRWIVEVFVDLARAGGTREVEVAAEVAGVRAAGRTDGDRLTLRVVVEDPALWWPRGHGAAHLHPLTVTVTDTGGGQECELDRWERRIGFRDIVLDTGADEAGSRFVLRVNGRPVFARGVNWIPDDTFVTRTDRARYRERLTDATEANVNLIRVWGGGLYESEDFYELCDELGLMVWQDFLFACAAYPEEEFLAAEVEAEAREQIVRLAPHPSLVLWNGNNENIWGWFDWGWRDALGGRTWGAGYYTGLLPRLVAELDPSRPYWPGTPYSGSMELAPNDDRHGTSHLWDVWNQVDYLVYREHSPRFVAEFGYQGPPAWSTVRRSVSGPEPTVDSPLVQHHQKAHDGHAKLQRGLAEHFGVPDGYDDWHFLTQVNQARAVRTGVEHFRALQPHCMGTIWWQLNDCWPGASWACVDGDGHRKPAWFALREAYRPRLLTLRPAAAGPDTLELVAVNDTDEPWRAPVDLVRYGFDGERIAARREVIDCPARSVRHLRVAAGVSGSDRPWEEFVRAVAGDARAEWFFLRDKELAYQRAEFSARATPVDGGWQVEVTAVTLLRDLWLFPDRLRPPASVEGVPVTVLPGESARFTVRCDDALDGAALTVRPVLRCVNDVRLPGSRPRLP